jgi:hypothetical protein
LKIGVRVFAPMIYIPSEQHLAFLASVVVFWLGLTTATATSALSRETPTKETPETTATHVEKRLKRLWVRIVETLKRLKSANAGRWWLVWFSGGRKWVLWSSKAVNAAYLAVFGPSTNSALSRQPESVKKLHMRLYDPPRLH